MVHLSTWPFPTQSSLANNYICAQNTCSCLHPWKIVANCFTIMDPALSFYFNKRLVLFCVSDHCTHCALLFSVSSCNLGWVVRTMVEGVSSDIPSKSKGYQLDILNSLGRKLIMHHLETLFVFNCTTAFIGSHSPLLHTTLLFSQVSLR